MAGMGREAAFRIVPASAVHPQGFTASISYRIPLTPRFLGLVEAGNVISYSTAFARASADLMLDRFRGLHWMTAVATGACSEKHREAAGHQTSQIPMVMVIW